MNSRTQIDRDSSFRTDEICEIRRFTRTRLGMVIDINLFLISLSTILRIVLSKSAFAHRLADWIYTSWKINTRSLWDFLI